jgi:predicted regulator of Ras-like GTPase activity (Roadblock/LC7/MglB family)
MSLFLSVLLATASIPDAGYSNQADIVEATTNTLTVAGHTSVNSLGGDDVFQVKVSGLSSQAAFKTQTGSTLSTAEGADSISSEVTGAGFGDKVFGILLAEDSVLDTGADRDNITALVEGYWSASNIAALKLIGSNLSSGNDGDSISAKLSAMFASASSAIDSVEGHISTSTGNDRIVAVLDVSKDAFNSTGLKNDLGAIDLGFYNDTIDVNVSVGRMASGTTAIHNTGVIDAGSGNDQVVARLKVVVNRGGNYGVFNAGQINFGEGNDTFEVTVEGLEPSLGIAGGGIVRLGPGDDTFKGFGDQVFYGDAGFDQVIVPFDFAAVKLGMDASGTIEVTIAAGITMTLHGIERLIFNDVSLEVQDLHDLISMP